MVTVDTMQLNARIIQLPQELRDMILDMFLDKITFASVLNGAVEINSDYTPPHSLRIDHTSRTKVAASYYSSTKLTVPYLPLKSPNLH
ncbi:hypothetical protein CLAFUW4_11946 [Fulvia fulva]|uniref:uncharacterized protein n=1 Tax=Passalora fulva TaxID=5499 RepID=UPI0028529B1A|nr:uncharacterized protein CLAFUR5_20324 [Fulvia fulva]KAK4618047.1 hypothetical protein CLAFUR4_11951 [Fulvia fulva]KAK4619181.1 hypothetical protein CLAFUR0_11962 [Fulvia fulva]WMI38973.1 hypothetical protein CLAFUR5_20324 [Fulvia fulva]WPV18564.1 hypothetical protein CLAFUW4_11946 [Fulvia fulva]WPV32851.1 hypothetical protein CLAFUW7_11953 [Fulvia fulva]